MSGIQTFYDICRLANVVLAGVGATYIIVTLGRFHRWVTGFRLGSIPITSAQVEQLRLIRLVLLAFALLVFYGTIEGTLADAPPGIRTWLTTLVLISLNVALAWPWIRKLQDRRLTGRS